MQTFKTANFGLVSFEKTWLWASPDRTRRLHLGLMAGGTYAHVPEGLPISNRQDIIDAIAPVADRDKALKWFDERQHATSPQHYLRKLYYEPEDGSWRYVDNGDVVDSMEDLHAALHGSALDGAVHWFKVRQESYQQGTLPADQTATKMADQRITEFLEAAPGVEAGAIAQALEIEPRVIVPILTSMREAGRVVVSKKLYYLPRQFQAMTETREE